MLLDQININFTLIAIASAFFAAIANLLARVLLKDLKSHDILGINFLTMGATLVLISPVFYRFKPTLMAMGLLALISLIDTLGNYFYFKTFERTEATIATPVLSLAPGFTFLFGWVLLGDVVSLKTFALAILIILCILFFSANFRNFRQSQKETLIPALAASALLGISAIPSKFLLDTLGVINAPTLYMFRAGFIALFSLLFFNFSVNHITITQYRIVFIRGLFVIVQWILLYYALSLGNAGITLTLGNVTPIFVSVLGIIFLKEKASFKRIASAALILILSLIL